MRTSHSKSLLKEKSSLKTFENAPYEKLIKNIVATQILIKWFWLYFIFCKAMGKNQLSQRK